jgi:formylglycine-generating enzyme required for sulfatase activity
MIRIPGKNYEIGKYDVTQKEWQSVMGSNPSHFTACGENCPVENVSWNDVHEFIQKLNAKTGRQYRLPIEEEWEYACYGGSQTEYCGGSNLDSVAWYDNNSNGTTHPVGQKQANGYGLFDMRGNVWQWMENEYGGGRALRGGSWISNSVYLRAAYRNSNAPSFRNFIDGFRLARTLP